MNSERFECLGDEMRARAHYVSQLKRIASTTIPPDADEAKYLREESERIDPDLYLWRMYGGVWNKP